MRFIFIAACAAFALSTPASATTLTPFTGFVGFGDSFSDKGRLQMLQPPSNAGRFTDGLSWMETLGAEFEARGQANFNMALGGATAGPINTFVPLYEAVEPLAVRDPNDPDDIPFVDLATLDDQIASFAKAGFANQTGDNPLVTMLIGGNDFGQNPAVDPASVIQEIANGILGVAALGPQYDSFMVANLFDFSIQPSNFNLDPLDKLAIRTQIMLFNNALAQSLSGLSFATGLEIEIFDFFSVNDSMYMEAIDAGLILDDTCTVALATLDFDPNNQCLAPGASEAFLFLDNTHPGDFAHSRWAEAAIAQVESRLAPIPLPSGLMLALGGFGALLVLRRKTQVGK
ncbi:MAG: SGNH/GDSL hydrolase family protein [Pseudomonadota bacterium]